MKKFLLWSAIIIALGALIWHFESGRIINSLLAQANKDLVQKSEKIISELKDLPMNLKDKLVVYGNPKADKVIIYAQGGPQTSLDITEALDIIKDQGKIDSEKVLIVDVHQCQTLKTDFYNKTEISFEDAKKCDEQTTKIMADSINYFKSKNKKVYLLGVSFGAFVVEDLLAEYGNMADKNFIVVGRLDMPEEVWRVFSEGNYAGFNYDKDGNVSIKPFSAEEAGMGGDNEIGDHNTSKIAAGIGYKRFTNLLNDLDLSNTIYAYGKRDEEVGRLSQEEVEFLKSKNVKIIEGGQGHSETIDMFSKKYLKDLLK